MEWSRIKTILIFVFAIVNIFLLSVYFKEANTGNTLSDDIILSTVEILKQNNIDIDKKIIPSNYDNVKVCTVENEFADVTEMLKSVGVKEDRIRVEENVFTYVPESNDEADKILEAILFSKYKKKEINGNEVYYHLKYGNKEFFDSYICIKRVDGRTEIEGKNWLFDKISEDGVAEIVSPAEILIDFASRHKGAERINITEMKQGYYIGERTGIVKTTASPVWRISTSDGKEFFYDMRNGDLLE